MATTASKCLCSHSVLDGEQHFACSSAIESLSHASMSVLIQILRASAAALINSVRIWQQLVSLLRVSLQVHAAVSSLLL